MLAGITFTVSPHATPQFCHASFQLNAPWGSTGHSIEEHTHTEHCMWMFREGVYHQNQLQTSLCYQIPMNSYGKQWDCLYGTYTKDGSQRNLDKPASSIISYKRLPDNYNKVPDFPFA